MQEPTERSWLWMVFFVALCVIGLETVIPALIPVAVDGVRALVNRISNGDGAKPSNPDDVVKLMQAETARLRALAEIDAGGSTYAWGEAARKLQRPVYGLVALIAYVGAINTETAPEVTIQVGQWVQMFGFYLFGDRTYMYLKEGRGR